MTCHKERPSLCDVHVLKYMYVTTTFVMECQLYISFSKSEINAFTQARQNSFLREKLYFFPLPYDINQFVKGKCSGFNTKEMD